MKILHAYLISFVGLLASVEAISHEVEFDEHVQLVPIPAYDHIYGEASGANALVALNVLLATLSDEQVLQMSFELDAEERHQWSNLPARRSPRPGMNIGAMSDEQRALLFKFLSASLSKEGYESVGETLAAEAFLAKDSRSGRFNWAPENYWLGIYGEPSNTSAWAWGFGGHHLGINISIDGGKVSSMSPHFVGAEPSQFTLNGIEYDAMADMHQAGYVVYQSLDDEQKKSATLSRTSREVQVGANKDGVIPRLEGISVSEMTSEQQALVLKAAYEWVSHQPQENAVPSMEKIESELGETFFAWYGDIGVTSPSYFRIQGPSVIIELLGGMRTVGDTARGLGHYHTVYRDPTDDYGLGQE